MKLTTHAACYAMLHAGDAIALIHKARGPHRGKWDLPGGGMNPDEGAFGTLIREIEEETGLQIKIDDAEITAVLNDLLPLDPSLHDGFDHMHHIGILYDVELERREGLKEDADGEDSLGAKWYALQEASELDLTPFARYAVYVVGLKEPRT